jgi:hypothetical protein
MTKCFDQSNRRSLGDFGDTPAPPRIRARACVRVRAPARACGGSKNLSELSEADRTHANEDCVPHTGHSILTTDANPTMNKPMTPNAYELREQRFKDWYRWRPVKGDGAICPRRVAGKHCLRFNFRFSKHCICNRSYRSDLFDHCALWRDENGDFVFTSELYHCRVSGLAQLSSDLSELGLEAEVLPRSGWNPNSTILIVVRRRRERVLDDKLDRDVLRERVSGFEDEAID